MSTWTREKHEAARARCEAATRGPWDDQPGRMGSRVILIDDWNCLWDAAGLFNDADGPFIAHARTDLPALLDEVERLRAESARRMVWLENEQKAHEQTHAALIYMTEQAAHPAITDDMVERAVAAHKAHSQAMHPRENYEYAACDECGWAFGWQGRTDPSGAQRVHEHAVRAALVAALNPGEGQ